MFVNQINACEKSKMFRFSVNNFFDLISKVVNFELKKSDAQTMCIICIFLFSYLYLMRLIISYLINFHLKFVCLNIAVT